MNPASKVSCSSRLAGRSWSVFSAATTGCCGCLNCISNPSTSGVVNGPEQASHMIVRRDKLQLNSGPAGEHEIIKKRNLVVWKVFQLRSYND